MVIATVACGLTAVLTARTLAILLPFRLRPFFDPALELNPHLFGFDPRAFNDMSSFPSDHATLFGALAFGIFLISRRVGTWMGLYVLVLVLIPRFHLGLHYPGDILGGLVIALGGILVHEVRM